MNEFYEQCQEKFHRRAVEHKRSLEPWKDYSLGYLQERLYDEHVELNDEIIKRTMSNAENIDAIMDECTDVANFAWFIYEWAKRKKDKKDKAK